MITKRILTFCLMVMIVGLTLGNTKCGKVDKETVETVLQNTYIVSESVRELNAQINSLYLQQKIGKESHDKVMRQGRSFFGTVEFVAGVAGSRLEEMRKGVITEQQYIDIVKTLLSDEFIYQLNKYLVEINLLTPDNAFVAVVQIIITAARKIITNGGLKNVRLVKMQEVYDG